MSSAAWRYVRPANDGATATDEVVITCPSPYWYGDSNCYSNVYLRPTDCDTEANNTPIPPTATPTRTNTAIPPTSTPTPTQQYLVFSFNRNGNFDIFRVQPNNAASLEQITSGSAKVSMTSRRG